MEIGQWRPLFCACLFLPLLAWALAKTPLCGGGSLVPSLKRLRHGVSCRCLLCYFSPRMSSVFHHVLVFTH